MQNNSVYVTVSDELEILVLIDYNTTSKSYEVEKVNLSYCHSLNFWLSQLSWLQELRHGENVRQE